MRLLPNRQNKDTESYKNIEILPLKLRPYGTLYSRLLLLLLLLLLLVLNYY